MHVSRAKPQYSGVERAHAVAALAELPVLEVVSGIHIIAGLTLGLGKVVHDYLA